MARRAPTSLATAIALTRTMTRLRSRLRQESSASLTEISMPQLMTLSRIVHEGPIANVTLAGLEHVRPQSMSEFVKALEDRGLVERLADPRDGRRILFAATDAGQAILDTVMEARHAWLSKAIEAECTPEERELLLNAVALMDRLAASR